MSISIPLRQMGEHLSIVTQLKKHGNQLLYHLRTAYLFSVDDLEAAVLTGFIFGVLNALTAPVLSMGSPVTPSRIITCAPAMLLWSWCTLLLHNVQNQRHPSSVAEDSVNKPWRPLPSGRITAAQAGYVMHSLYPINLAISSMVGGLVPFLVIAVFSFWHNEMGGAHDGILKNIHSAVGLASFMAGPLEIATGQSIFSGDGTAAIWLSVLAGTISTTIHTQDLRDMAGDKAIDRHTIPLTIGDTNARVLVALGVVFWTLGACLLWGMGWAEWLWPTSLGLLLVFNMFINRTHEGEGLTYRLWSLWILGLVSLPFVKGMGGAVWR
jgi:4-hydroxybenzoate polyprenyltransferase